MMTTLTQKNAPFPNFFIVGAAKAGTTSFFHYLNVHPDIYMCPIKEPHHFSTDINIENFRSDYKRDCLFDPASYFSTRPLQERHSAYVQNPDDYKELFSEAGIANAIGEASVSYLYSQTAAQNIKRANPDARIIILLRNPIERAYSHFLMDLRDGHAAAPDFITAVKLDQTQNHKGWGISNLYVELGLYAAQIARYMDIFPKDRIRVYLQEDYKADLTSVISDIYRFLGVDSTFQAPKLDQTHNKASIPRFYKLNTLLARSGLKTMIGQLLPTKLRKQMKTMLFKSGASKPLTKYQYQQLLPLFEEDINKLSTLIDRDLHHWLSPRERA
jgi:hypothetical protein